MTHYDATFWVGANAILRKRALDDIVEIDYEGDWRDPPLHPGPHGHRGHRVDASTSASTAGRSYNYPERLAYSATPPDFGSLCIQRQRWANGGLLILPKLRRAVAGAARRGRAEPLRRAVPAGQLHGVDLLGARSAC